MVAGGVQCHSSTPIHPVRSGSQSLLLHPSQQIKIIQLVPIPQDVPLHLTPIHPRHVVLHPPRHQERRVRHDLRAHAHVPLLHEPHRRRHVLRHAQARHDDAEPPPREAGDADLPLHVAEFGRAGRGEDAGVVELGEEEGLVFEADGVVRGEVGEGVGELAEGAADFCGGFSVSPVSFLLCCCGSGDLGGRGGGKWMGEFFFVRLYFV